MAAKRSKKKTASKAKKRQPGWFRRYLLKCLVVLGVIFAGWVIFLDAQVTQLFDSRRWSLPAKVYARPLELYAGLSLSRSDLAYELDLLGYDQTYSLAKPGSYQLSNQRLSLYTRGFDFWQGYQPGQKIQVLFDGDRVRAVGNESGQSLDYFQLEPVLIGGIYPLHNEDRSLIKLGDVPQVLIDALIQVEDRDFYSHWGVSPKAIARAFLVNFRSGSIEQGGSTLTQQLVKNMYLTSERSLVRKINEAMMAVLLDFHYSKDDILEAYLNEVYLGQSGSRAIHGFGLASQFYFGVGIGELNNQQAALLASLVKGPSYYNPRQHPERSIKRRNLVLGLLKDADKLSASEVTLALASPLGILAQPRYVDNRYPAYMDLVKSQLLRDYDAEDLSSEGLRIFTALDPLVQRQAEQSLSQTLDRLRPEVEGEEAVQGAVIVSQRDTAEVQAVVGGRDASYEGFNRALNAYRPVGSVIKPAVYLTALSQPGKYQLSTLIEDSELELLQPNGETWAPQNYEKISHGLVPLNQALVHSYNQATAHLGLAVGLGNVIDTLHDLGIEKDLAEYPSLLLGAVELSPLDVTRMYQTIAADGFDIPLRSIREVTSADNEVLSRYSLELEQHFDYAPVFLLQYALQRAVEEGTGKSLANIIPNKLPVAGKTGTTDDLRDSWFAGYTGDRLAVVWLGRDNNQPIGLTGATGALQVWGELMKGLDTAPLTSAPPENIQYLWVDEASGLLSAQSCDGVRYLPFIKGSEPEEKSDCLAKEGGLRGWIKSWLN